MLIILKSVARTLILPPSGLLLVALVGLLLYRRRPKLGGTLVVVGVVLLWVLSTPWVANGLQRMVERCPPLDLSHPVNAQAVVILGGGTVRFAPEYAGPAAEFQTLERLNYGAYVAHRTSLPVLVTGSGGEADAMRATLLRDFGITTRWFENRAGDTFENARFSARLLRADGVTRIILVTNSAHEWRAVQEFMAAGLEVVPAPVGTLRPKKLNALSFVPSAEGMVRSHAAVYEMIGEPVRELFAVLHLRRQQPGD
jgi:uncharacterized SAM-binding protein YcdF (DUF218 family)